MLDAILINLLTDWAWDWWKSIKDQIDQKPWDQLYLAAFDAVVRKTNNRREASGKTGGFVAPGQELIDILRQDLLISSEDQILNRISRYEFVGELAKAIEKADKQGRAVILASMEGEDYNQQ